MIKRYQADARGAMHLVEWGHWYSHEDHEDVVGDLQNALAKANIDKGVLEARVRSLRASIDYLTDGDDEELK